MGRTTGNVAFMSWLPGAGMHYQCFVNKDKKITTKRVLSTNDTNAILSAFKEKHGFSGPGNRAKFDEEIARLIISGADLIKVSCSEGREIPEGADFWGQAKKQTLLEHIKDSTVYRFALKLLEARKHGLDKAAERALEKGLPMTNRHEGMTVKALDSFVAAVEVASALHPVQALNLNACMDGDLAQELVSDNEVADAEDEHDDDFDDLTDNLSVQPVNQSSTAGINLTKSGGSLDASFITGVQASGECGEGSKYGEALASIDTTGFMPYTNDDDYMYDDDDDYIDENIDLSEDEFGMKGKQVLENIEETDAWHMYCRENKFVPMEDFLKTPMAKKIMAERAPRLTSLLNATVMAQDDYEHDLEKHLLRRAKLSPEQMQQREDNREKTWEEFDARRRGKQVERHLAQQAALLSVAGYDGRVEGDEGEDGDGDGYGDGDGDVEMAD